MLLGEEYVLQEVLELFKLVLGWKVGVEQEEGDLHVGGVLDQVFDSVASVEEGALRIRVGYGGRAGARVPVSWVVQKHICESVEAPGVNELFSSGA